MRKVTKINQEAKGRISKDVGVCYRNKKGRRDRDAWKQRGKEEEMEGGMDG